MNVNLIECLQMVQEFHKAFGVFVPTQPIDRGHIHTAFRHKLLQEEFNETIDGILNEDLVEVLDGVIDQIYICLGTISDFGDGKRITANLGIFESHLFNYEVQLPKFPSMLYIDNTRKLVEQSKAYDASVIEKIIVRNLKYLRRCGLYSVFMDGFREVHRSNMSKLGEGGNPIYNEVGKVMKGPNYSKPQLANIIYVF
jgi:predicted HAD superfamily Cof-like phosphohydrolase